MGHVFEPELSPDELIADGISTSERSELAAEALASLNGKDNVDDARAHVQALTPELLRALFEKHQKNRKDAKSDSGFSLLRSLHLPESEKDASDGK